MAAAFAALVSLQHNLHHIQNHPLHSSSFEDKQIKCLGESVSFLIDFMKSYDNSHGARKEAAEALERRIGRAAQAAEDVMESHIVDQIRGGKTRTKSTSCRFLLDVQKVIEGMDYMKRKAINVKARRGMETEQEQPTYSAAAAATSSTPLTSNHTSMVGFDDVLDMWSVEAWDDMKFFFPDTDNGSRIVVTTRHSDVADHLSILRLAMSFLNENNSWDLFCQKTFGEQRCCPPELEEIGKKIVEKCKGLPLAIVVVGGHLKKSSMALEYWENVASHMNSILNSTEEQCLNVLSLSYSYLPVHLKPCFLLMGAFPEDQMIYEGDVVKLWIAEGIIEPFENTRLEEIAEDYLWDLFERNLIFVHAFGFNGKIVKFKLHDLVRELCLRIAKKEEFLYVLIVH